MRCGLLRTPENVESVLAPQINAIRTVRLGQCGTIAVHLSDDGASDWAAGRAGSGRRCARGGPQVQIRALACRTRLPRRQLNGAVQLLAVELAQQLLRVRASRLHRDSATQRPDNGADAHARRIDVSTSVSVSQFQCLSALNLQFAVVRCFRSTGSPDPNCAPTTANGWAGGMKARCAATVRCGAPLTRARARAERGRVLLPLPHLVRPRRPRSRPIPARCSGDASSQVSAMVSYFNANQVQVTVMWLDIEGVAGRVSPATARVLTRPSVRARRFPVLARRRRQQSGLVPGARAVARMAPPPVPVAARPPQSLVDACSSAGLNIGVYSSRSQWEVRCRCCPSASAHSAPRRRSSARAATHTTPARRCGVSAWIRPAPPRPAPPRPGG